MLRINKLLLLCAVLVASVVLCTTGCTSNNTNNNLVNYGRIRLTYENLPKDVSSMYISLYNGSGACIWGPKSVDVADYPTNVMLYQVNKRCKAIAIGCYDEEATSLKYFYSQAIEIKANETLDISNPDFQKASSVSFLQYGFVDVLEQRGHTGDTICFQSMACAGTAKEHYWMDISEFCTWTVDTNYLSATSKDNTALSKGYYRCLKSTSEGEYTPVSAKLGNNESKGTVEITNATVTDIALYATAEQAWNHDPEISTSLALPTGADYRYIYCLAEWSDNQYSMVNTSASWENSDTIGALAGNCGRVRSYVIDEKSDQKWSDNVIVKAIYTSNSKKYTAQCTMVPVDSSFTTLKTPSVDVSAESGDLLGLIPMGIYGSDIEMEMPMCCYSVKSDDATVVEPVASNIHLFTCKDIGNAVLTFTDSLKNTTAAYNVEVKPAE